MIRKFIGFALQFIGSAMMLVVGFFTLGAFSAIVGKRYEELGAAIIFGLLFLGVAYLFYKAGEKVILSEKIFKFSFSLNSQFKRIMFLVFAISLLIVIVGFVLGGLDPERVFYYVFEQRYPSAGIGKYTLRLGFIAFPVSLFLMFYGEKIWGWIKNGSSRLNEDRK